MHVTVQLPLLSQAYRSMYAPAPPPGQRHSPFPTPPPAAPQKHQYPAPIGSPYYPQQQHAPPPQRHKGTLHPGQIVNVDQCHVRIERYLSEGGYAHVYLTSSDRPVYPPSRGTEKKGRWGEKGYTQHCLKRIAFQDDSVWVDVKKEIEVMVRVPYIMPFPEMGVLMPTAEITPTQFSSGAVPWLVSYTLSCRTT